MTISSSRLHRNVPAPGGATAGQSGLHARFIPREEVSSFSAWSPGHLAGTAGMPAASGRSVAEHSAADAEQIAALTKTARQSGYQDGYRDGLVALEGFKQTFAMQSTQQIGLLVLSVGQQLDSLQQEMAEALVATAINLARQVVRSELALRPEVVARVAGEAVDTLLLNARHISVRVHPDDQALVAAGAAEALAARGARLVADPSIGRGGCRVESDVGLVDATVETRWSRATAAFGLDLPWSAAPAADSSSAA